MKLFVRVTTLVLALVMLSGMAVACAQNNDDNPAAGTTVADTTASASADTMATYEVMMAMLDKYKDREYTDNKGITSIPVQNDMQQLSVFSSHNKNADLMGQIVFDEDGKEVFKFGKHKDRRVEEVFRIEPQYYDWIMKSDFPEYTKKVITGI